MAKQYHYTNAGIVSRNGKDKIKAPNASEETRHLFQAILANLNLKIMDDSIQGARMADALDEAEGKDEVVLGEGVYDWLKKKIAEIDQEGGLVLVRMFRTNGSIVNDFIREGFEKPHQPKETTARKKEPDAPAAE